MVVFRLFQSLAAASVFWLWSKIEIIWRVCTVRRDDIVVPVSCPVSMAAIIAGYIRLRSGQTVSTYKVEEAWSPVCDFIDLRADEGRTTTIFVLSAYT